VRKWEFFARNVEISGDVGGLRNKGCLLMKKGKEGREVVWKES
jgi:hypothetical protein